MTIDQRAMQLIIVKTRAAQHRLTDHDLASIAWSDPCDTTVAIAERLQKPYDAVVQARRRLQRKGYACELFWRRCDVCGENFAASSSRQIMHVRCRASRAAERQRRRWPSIAEREALRFQRLPASEQALALERVHIATSRDQHLTVSYADRRGVAWSASEDEYVLTHLKSPARDVALALQRTLWAVKGRRRDLRKQLRELS
jgi:hypothetical protein